MNKMTQEEWDTMLVDCFYNHPSVSMWRLVEHRDLSEFSHILRIPRQEHLGMGIIHFVSCKLPKLSKILWDNKPNRAPNIIKALQKSKLDTAKERSPTTPARGKELREYRNDRKKIKLVQNKRSIYNSRNSGTDWKTCK